MPDSAPLERRGSLRLINRDGIFLILNKDGTVIKRVKSVGAGRTFLRGLSSKRVVNFSLRTRTGLAHKTESLPERTADTMSEAIALSSPSGRMSKAARKRADERLRISLFGEEGLQRTTTQPDEQVILRRQASQLRELADRGLSPRKNRAAAKKLEARIRTPRQRDFDRA